MTKIIQHFAKLRHYQVPWNGKCFESKSSMFFKKCLILNRSFKWSVKKTLLQLMKRFCSTSVGSQTSRDNMLALANSVHLAVFPFLDWELDFLLHCLYRKTQTTQDHAVATVFRRRSCTWIEDISQLHVQPFSFSQSKHPYHAFELMPSNRPYRTSLLHTLSCCHEGLWKSPHKQTASICLTYQLTHLCAYVRTGEHLY